MNGWETFKVGAAITGTILVMFGLHGVASFVFPETYLAVPAYKVAGVNEPAVDLVALQRSWPAGMRAQGGRATVRGFMANIETVKVAAPAEATPTPAAPAPQVDLGTLLAAADVTKGQQTAQVCTSCHTFEQGGADRTGPSLWGVVGRNVGSHPGFAYSDALKAQSGPWTYERLDHWLTNPAKAVPGTKMGFAGIHNPQDRANVIAYLSTLGASRIPFPKPEKTKTAESASPAAKAG